MEVIRRPGAKLTPPATNKEEQLKETLDYYRGMMLDMLEVNYGDLPSWQRTRSAILRALGDTGLEAKLRKILN